MKILMLETMTYGDDISLEQFNRLGEVVTYSLSSYEEAVVKSIILMLLLLIKLT